MVYVEAAAKSIAPVLKKGAGHPESTSPVGATEQTAEWLAEARLDLSFPQQAGQQADINIAGTARARAARSGDGRTDEKLSRDRRMTQLSARASELYRFSWKVRVG
ncbi:hypothetical protein ACNKHO_24155 [Shigella flexneri]